MGLHHAKIMKGSLEGGLNAGEKGGKISMQEQKAGPEGKTAGAEAGGVPYFRRTDQYLYRGVLWENRGQNCSYQETTRC